MSDSWVAGWIGEEIYGLKMEASNVANAVEELVA